MPSVATRITSYRMSKAGIVRSLMDSWQIRNPRWCARILRWSSAAVRAAVAATIASAGAVDGSSKPRRSSSKQFSICNERKATLKHPKTLEQICRECFYVVFEEEIHKAIMDNNFFRPGEKVVIDALGGKGFIQGNGLMRILHIAAFAVSGFAPT